MTPEFTRRDLEQCLGFEPSDEQWEAIGAPLEPAVIVAGAGTGKTTSMSARVAYLVGTGAVDPDRVLGLTFTNKAASQLLTAIRDRVRAVHDIHGARGAADADDDTFDPEPTVATYHAFAGRIVGELGLRIGREPDATLLTDGARHQRAYSLVCGADAVGSDSLGADLAALGKSPVSITSSMLDLDSELSEVAVDPTDVIAHDRALIAALAARGAVRGTGREIREAAEQRIALARLVQEWRSYKARRDLWDYSDQVRLALEIMQRFPESAIDIRRRYDIVLLDEYQDTSIAQRLLLQSLFGDGFPVTAVGDPCQAIYGWRGASVDNIEAFPRHFPRDDGRPAQRYALTENRRSGPSVLHVANELAVDLRAEHTGSRPLVPAADSPAAGVDVALFASIDEEVDYLAHAIRSAHASTSAVTESHSAIAVLCTTGADIRRIDAALHRLGVPTQVSGAAALLADPAVADLRALLEVVYEPTANPAMVRLLTGARWRVGARDLAALGARASELAGGRSRPTSETLEAALDEAVAGTDPVDVVSLADAAADPGESSRYSDQAREAFADITAVIDALRRETGGSVVDLIASAMVRLGVDIEARIADPSGGSSAALADLLALAAQFTDADRRMGLGGFLAHLRDAERFDVTITHTRPAIPGAVQLMTVFAAKGLEFSRVFMPFVSEGAFPGGRHRGRWTTGAAVVPWPVRDDAPAALQSFPYNDDDSINKQHDRYLEGLAAIKDRDHERLAYVGATRAEHHLTVTGHWWGPGQSKPRGPHRFLEQIRDAVGAADPDLCRVVAWAPPPDDNESNPVTGSSRYSWPQPVVPSYREQVARGARDVREAIASRAPSVHEPTLVSVDQHDVVPAGADAEGGVHEQRINAWHETFVALAEESQPATQEPVVRLGEHVGASTFLRALKDPEQLAIDLLRPMPRKPSPAAARGVAWHAWVETVFGQQSLWGMDDLPGAADADIASDEQLEELKRAFERTRYAAAQPVAVERAFSLIIGGRVVAGRIDAVFFDNGRYEVVDWKTGNTAGVDPRQLAIYRLAWAQIAGVDVAEVDAAFVMIANGEELRPDTDDEISALLALGVR